jgi:flagellar biosynthesis/type III secretory pathway protein FliH
MYRSYYSGLRASLFAIALLAPIAAVSAQAQAVPRGSRTSPAYSQAYDEGYQRGLRAGLDDGQRNRDFNYASKSDYRNADAGYRREYGDRSRYSTDFRIGYESGYRNGYNQARPNGSGGVYRDGGVYGPYGNGNGNGGWRPGTGGPPPWANGRARGRGGYQTNDYASQTGYTDGYEAGLNDGRARHQFDPVGESRYRSGDHGYKSSYGSRDSYKNQYRDSFRDGYQSGYEDGRRYDNGNTRSDGRPSWWPW